MEKDSVFWMKMAIDVANLAQIDCLRVGAVLVSINNDLICTAASGEILFQDWKTTLINKLKAKDSKEQIGALFLTINTISSDKIFDLKDLRNYIAINQIYIGLPDPNLNEYLDEDPVLSDMNIQRFSESLQLEILQQNLDYYMRSSQNIQNSPYYSNFRIGKMIRRELNELGYYISEIELREHNSKNRLVNLLIQKYSLEKFFAKELVEKIISEGFNKKYGHYEYIHDTRILKNWEESFWEIYKQTTNKNIIDASILNVGVGGGNEAKSLFYRCNNITYVDIATAGLLKIKKENPKANILVTSAENLSTILNESQDIYISLRTFNSSYFDIYESIMEAYRVLRHSGSIILSIANGFLDLEQKKNILGLIIPKSFFVDIYRGLHTANDIRRNLDKAGFKEIRFYSANTELYLTARK